MTSRERVLTALDHREPDRVPLDLGGTFCTGIAAQAVTQLRRQLGLADHPVKVYDLYQVLGEVELDLVERLGLDCLPVFPPTVTMGLRNEAWQTWTLMDGTQVMVPGSFEVEVTPAGDWLFYPQNDRSRPPNCRMPKGGFYFDTIGYGDFHPDWEPPPLESLRGMVDWRVPDETLRWLQDRAHELHSTTDKCIVAHILPGIGWGYVGSLTDFWCLLGRDPEYVKELFALYTERTLANLPRYWEALGSDVDVVFLTGLDFGTQKSEWFKPETFRDVYLPHLATAYAWIHEHTTWQIFEHSCGSIPSLVGMMADAGLDALNPVQTSAAGMDPQWLKDTVGDQLTFWGGGVETQSTLPFGTPDEVRAEVAERLRIFGPGGGFVFCPIHNVQANTPPENLVAAYETARELGTYPLNIADSTIEELRHGQG